jgi:hypothetical protein
VVLAKDFRRESIAEAAIPILTDPDLASSLGHAGHKRVKSVFLEAHFAKRFRRALEQLIQTDSLEEIEPSQKQPLQSASLQDLRTELVSAEKVNTYRNSSSTKLGH